MVVCDSEQITTPFSLQVSVVVSEETYVPPAPAEPGGQIPFATDIRVLQSTFKGFFFNNFLDNFKFGLSLVANVAFDIKKVANNKTKTIDNFFIF